MKVIVGIAGEKGSGKDTFAQLCIQALPNVSVGRVQSSSVLRETLALWNIESNRANLQDLAIIMDKKFGLGTLTNVISRRIERMNENIILFDAVRWQSDVEMIRKFPKGLIVYITASLETRYQRTKIRKEKIGESNIPFEQFIREEQAATETAIAKIGAAADAVIVNDGSIADLEARVKKFCTEKLAKLL